jgi:hypothetical protein
LIFEHRHATAGLPLSPCLFLRFSLPSFSESFSSFTSLQLQQERLCRPFLHL